MEDKPGMLNKYKVVIWLTFILIVAFQIPFLHSDPDKNISIGRDANTDEGLYSYQIRNYIHHNDLSLYTSDGLLKTPLFGFILFPVLKLFGTELFIARLWVLLLSLGICLYAFNSNKFFIQLGISSSFVVLMQYYIFHYFHFSMTDTLATVCVFLAIVLIVKSENVKSKSYEMLFPAAMISCAYFIKIQYLYIVLLIPLILIVWHFFNIGNEKISNKKLLYFLIYTAGFFVLYILCWYLPNMEIIQYILSEQSVSRFPEKTGLYNQLKNNVNYFLLNDYLKQYTFAFFIFSVYGVFCLFRNTSLLFKRMFVALLSWIFLESHKLFMTYLPARYQISLIFAMGLVIALMINQLMHEKVKYGGNFLKFIFVVVLVTLSFKNVRDYFDSFKNRTFAIEKMDNYLNQFDFKKSPVIGVWATAVAWKSGAFTLPVWDKFFNDSAVIDIHHPAIVISEIDEDDSGNSFTKQGLNLNEMADSIKTFRVNYWKMNMYWLSYNQKPK